MKTLATIFLCLTTLSCSTRLQPKDTKISRSQEMQQEIDPLLAEDAKNKRLELEFHQLNLIY